MRHARLLVLALAAGCSGGAPPPPSTAPQTAPDAGLAQTPSPETRAPASPEDAGSPGVMPIVAAQALVHDVATPLSRDQLTLVDPASRFRVEIQASIEDARLVLLDEQDAMVPVEGTTEVEAAATRFTLTPSEPLRPGSSYTLRLEGASSRKVHDAGRRAYLPSVLRLRTTGERPAPAPARRSKRGKKRRP